MNEAAITQGYVIPQMKGKGLLRGVRARLVIDACNAFLSLLVLPKGAGELLISQQNAILRLKDTGSDSGAASVDSYKFVSMEDDYLVCHTWDGVTEGSDDVFITKPPVLRFSISSTTYPGGTTVNYSDYDTSAQTRTADDGTTTQTEQITQPYVSGCLIYAITAPTFITVDDESLTLLDMNVDARAWMAVEA